MTLPSNKELIQGIRRVYPKATTMCVVLSVLSIGIVQGYFWRCPFGWYMVEIRRLKRPPVVVN